MSQNPTAPAPPDVRQLGQQALPEASFPGGRNQPFRVFFRPQAHDGVWAHAAESAAVEICGVLVGRWARDADGPYVQVEDVVRGDAAASQFAEVTFTHETWAKINEQMDTRFKDLSIVGWYHSHPDFGIFLSDRDRFIQEHFFSGAGQIALVVDPVRRTEGVFVWDKGKPALAPHCWVGDRLRASTAVGAEPAAGPNVTGGGPAAGAPPPEPGLFPDWAIQALFGLMLFLLGMAVANWLFSGPTRAQQLQIEQAATVRTLAVVFGLGNHLDAAADELDRAAQEADALAGKDLDMAKRPEQTRKQWEKVLGRVKESRDFLRKVRRDYALTVDDLAAALRAGARDKKDAAGEKKGDPPAGGKKEAAGPK